MQNFRRTIVILGVSSLFAAACGAKNDPDQASGPLDDGGAEEAGGSGGPGGSEPDGPPAPAVDAGGNYDTAPIPAMLGVAEAPAAFASLMCEKVYGCCPRADQARLPVENQAACEQAFTELLKPLATQIAASVTAGRVSYDGVALGGCLRAYQSTNCDAARPLGTVISYRECSFLTPLVELGQRCEQNFDCKAGFCAMGTCVAKKADGQACGEDDECTARCSPQAPRTCAAGAATELCKSL